MDERKIKFDLIKRRLAYLQTEVSNDNSLNLTDINIHAENFYRDFFNLLGYSFTNTNFEKQNAAHIDLVDESSKLVMQVTSQNDNKKIKESIDGFYKKSENKDYKLQILLIAKEAKEYKTPFGHKFNHTNDVLDVKKILKKIENKTTSELSAIANFLDKEILTERPKTECSEVETIMTLIDYLSEDKNRILSDKEGIVDPQKKIQERFSEYSTFIIEQYQDLYTVYNGALAEARKGIDTVDSIIISSYLKDESDTVLMIENSNPRLALSKLVDFFYNKLSVNGSKFNKQAIKFYLLDELIKCNVFPNK